MIVSRTPGTMMTRKERFRRASLEAAKHPSSSALSEEPSVAETEPDSDFDDSTYSQNNFAHLQQQQVKKITEVEQEQGNDEEDQQQLERLIANAAKRRPKTTVKRSSTEGDLPMRRRLIEGTPTAVLKSCLKKSASCQDIPICTKSRSWNVLPVPEIIKKETASSTASPVFVERNNRRQRHMPRKVSFDRIVVREYDQTLGDNPCVCYGPPITLDWKYEEMEAISVEDWEGARGERRCPREMLMNYYTRRNLLMWVYGFSEQELKKAKREAEKVQRQRAVTKYFTPMLKVEDVMESAARKAKRVVGGGKAKK
jgi:hypothetical protein